MRNILEVSNEEKNRILYIHETATKRQYLNEQITNESKEFPLNYNFVSGSHSAKANPELVNAVSKLFAELSNYLKEFDISTVEIDVQSSESRVPNKDAENNKKELKQGELGQKRAQTIIELLTNFFNQYKLPIPKMTPVVLTGGPKWGEKGSPTDPKDDEYKKYQYVKLVVKATGGCLANATIHINYDYNECSTRGHRCNYASFYIYANDILLESKSGKNYADLNNDSDGGIRKNEFLINSELAKQILANGKEIKIEIQCAIPTNEKGYDGKLGLCHQDAPCVSVTNAKGEKIVNPFLPYNGNLNTKDNPSAKILLCTLDECGRLIPQTTQ